MDKTSYRYNLEYRASVRARMLELVKQLLSGELGSGQRRVHCFLVSFRHGVEPDVGAILDIVAGIDSATDSFPLGEVRRH